MKKTLLLIMVLLCTMALLFSQSFAEEHESKEQRIVSLAPNITEIICELGSIDNLVGRTDYCNYPNEVLSITSVGTLYEPNIEVILSLEPTVVIASSIVDPAFVQSLEKAGIKTVQIYKEESLNGTYDLIAEVASAIGKETEGQVVINSMKERINAVQQKVSSIKEEDKKSCMYLISWGDWGDYGATGETYLNDVIKAAGAINSGEQGQWWAISKELLLDQDPNFILLGAYSYTDIPSTIDSFVNSEPYNKLSASKNGNVITINGDAAERQGVRTAMVIEEIAQLLYPQLF